MQFVLEISSTSPHLILTFAISMQMWQRHAKKKRRKILNKNFKCVQEIQSSAFLRSKCHVSHHTSHASCGRNGSVRVWHPLPPIEGASFCCKWLALLHPLPNLLASQHTCASSPRLFLTTSLVNMSRRTVLVCRSCPLGEHSTQHSCVEWFLLLVCCH